MEKIKINTESINLSQFLKWGNIVSTGGEAKLLIKKGKVMVNGEIEKRRSFTLYPGDIITIGKEEYKLISQ
ncbi:RNA-binding S4 domain-containing protein [Sporohalobacter salinus]|uniref:RNA-binding S4 domain-containing protein n=1 Tax=Sporohalobacter salinus TaxID=1494606 RepID=UPI00195FB7E4|nr:ribosome-associated protein [Sporohalobacter salinus]